MIPDNTKVWFNYPIDFQWKKEPIIRIKDENGNELHHLFDIPNIIHELYINKGVKFDHSQKVVKAVSSLVYFDSRTELQFLLKDFNGDVISESRVPIIDSHDPAKDVETLQKFVSIIEHTRKDIPKFANFKKHDQSIHLSPGNTELAQAMKNTAELLEPNGMTEMAERTKVDAIDSFDALGVNATMIFAKIMNGIGN